MSLVVKALSPVLGAEIAGVDLGKDLSKLTMLVSNIRENGKVIGSLPDGEMHFHSDMCYLEFN